MYDGDDYLLKALDELRRRTAKDDQNKIVHSTAFQSSTLEELSWRILRESGLKSELSHLTKDASELLPF